MDSNQVLSKQFKKVLDTIFDILATIIGYSAILGAIPAWVIVWVSDYNTWADGLSLGSQIAILGFLTIIAKKIRH